MNCVTLPCLMMIISSWPSWRWNAWPSPGSGVTSITTRLFAPVLAGPQRQPIVPQSNCSCSTSDCFTKVLIALPPWRVGRSDANRLETAHVLGHRDLGGQPFHRRGAEEADDSLGLSDHVGGVLGLGDRAAVAEDEDLGVDALRCVVHRLDQGHALLERLRGR